MMKKSFRILGVMAIALSITACGSKATSSTVASTDLDAIVAQKVQEQLEIDRRVKESVAAATQEITITPTEASTEAPSASIIPNETSKTSGTYLLPFSNERLVTDADLATLSKDQLRLARNEIFARYGRIFKSDDLNNYFKSQGWYTPSIPSDQFKESILSKVESDNVARISAYEKSGSVESKPMQLKTGSYVFSDTTNSGDGTYDITINPMNDWPIYFEYNYSDAYHPATDYIGYMTDTGNGTYVVTESSGTDGSGMERVIMTIKMTPNGFKDVATGDMYVYSN